MPQRWFLTACVAPFLATSLTTEKIDEYSGRKLCIPPTDGDSTRVSSLLQRGMRAKPFLLKDELNLCIEERLVPELFVIGAQKSGTTSFAMELISGSSDIILPVSDEDYEKKEPHSFDWKYNEGMQGWLSRWPPCQHDHRVVAVDMTPILHTPQICVPCRIQERYQDLSRRLKFVVILRNPLERMQSAFYHGQAGYHKDWYFDITFEQYVKLILDDPDYCLGRQYEDEQRSYNEDPFCDSLYAEQLTKWLKHFDGSQMTVVPFKLIVNRPNNAGSFAETIYSQFGISGVRMPAEQANAREHKSLEEDLEPELRTKFEAFLNDRTGIYAVARVLAFHGVNLYDFKGPDRVENAIAEWLDANW